VFEKTSSLQAMLFPKDAIHPRQSIAGTKLRVASFFNVPFSQYWALQRPPFSGLKLHLSA
jgi:hypothetical protein